jgi:DNA-binding CsgD family transcriptional regulator
VATVSLYVAESEVVLAIVDGRLEEALALLQRLVDIADESGAPIRGRVFAVAQLLAPALYLGRADIWLTASEEQSGPASLAPSGVFGSFLNFAARAVCLAQLGRLEEARAVVGPVLNDIKTISFDGRGIQQLVMLLQAAIVVEHQAACEVLAERLACVAHLIGEGQPTIRSCVARHLGDAAALVGDRMAAHAYYAQALDVAGKTRFRPELALTHLRLAELQVGDEQSAARSEALEHLALAIPELREMNMRLALEHGLSLVEQIEDRTPAPTSDATVSHVLTGREREVVRLLAAGRSNREIADQLVISEGTVEVHVKHILSKLGMKSRSQVAVWAADERI